MKRLFCDGREGWVAYEPCFFADSADRLRKLVSTLPWRIETIFIGGRDVAMPRATSYHGDSGCEYRYSGKSFVPEPWTAELLDVRERVKKECEVPFNTVLANYYRSGKDSISFHSDDEPELGPSWPENVVVASVSFGMRRRFVLRRKDRTETLDFELGEGDLFVMGGAVQSCWEHAVPKTKRSGVLPRLNLTFRVIDRKKSLHSV